MRSATLQLLLAATVGTHVAALSAQSSSSRPETLKPVIRNYFKLPLGFERHGTGVEEKFVARGQGYAIALSNGKATLGILSRQGDPGRRISISFIGGRAVRAVPEMELPGKVNHIEGNDPRKWQTGLSTWERVKYRNVYPGIDVVYYGNQQRLEFDLLVSPGADPEAIRMTVDGTSRLSLDPSGAVIIDAGEAGDLRMQLPQIHQMADGRAKPVSGHYSLKKPNELAFHVDPYDHSLPLVIDPTITYSTIFGGSGSSSWGNAITSDSTGNILIAGTTYAS